MQTVYHPLQLMRRACTNIRYLISTQHVQRISRAHITADYVPMTHANETPSSAAQRTGTIQLPLHTHQLHVQSNLLLLRPAAAVAGLAVAVLAASRSCTSWCVPGPSTHTPAAWLSTQPSVPACKLKSSCCNVAMGARLAIWGWQRSVGRVVFR